jgi:hypothetical protein
MQRYGKLSRQRNTNNAILHGPLVQVQVGSAMTDPKYARDYLEQANERHYLRMHNSIQACGGCGEVIAAISPHVGTSKIGCRAYCRRMVFLSLQHSDTQFSLTACLLLLLLLCPTGFAVILVLSFGLACKYDDTRRNHNSQVL